MAETTRFVPTLEWLRGYKAQIEALAAEHGASNVRVFGSVARGDATPDSDVDLLVDQDWDQLSGWGGMRFILALEDLLGCAVDVATEEELKPAFRRRVIEEVIAL